MSCCCFYADGPDLSGDFVVNDSQTNADAGGYNPQITVYGNDGAWAGTN